MPALKRSKVIGVKWITAAEAAVAVDRHARCVLNVSGKQFINEWKAGKYRKLDSDDCPGVIELALLAPLPRMYRGRKDGKRSQR